MKFWFRHFVFYLVPVVCVSADWPVPKSIKCDSSGTFHCKNTGVYEDPFDFTCTKYFLCNEFPHEIVEVELICPENTFFDPVKKHCSGEYKCICNNDTDSTTSEPTVSSSILKNKIPWSYPDDCQICSQCITSVSSKLTTASSNVWTTPSVKTTPSYITLTEDTPTTRDSSDSTTDNTEKTTTSPNYTWITQSTETTNSEYLDYSSLSSATNISTILSTTANSSTSDITITATTSNNCSLEGNFTCTKTGRFRNPIDPSCISYFYCYVWSNGTVSQYLYSCSIGSFNPDSQACDLSYICLCSEATTTETISVSATTQEALLSSSSQVPTSTHRSSTTESTTITSAPPRYCNLGGKLTCTKTGRFANPDDPSCNSYFYCYVWSNATVGQYLYSCSIGSFNPRKGACDVSHVCPCLDTSRTETTSAFTTIQDISTAESTTVSTTAPKYCDLGENFTCIKTGRFANPNDPSCKSYFYCYIWSNRTVGQYLYSCSIGLFNPNKGACDVSHVCPCLDTTRTETTSVFTTIQDISTAESTTVSTTAPKYCDLGGNFTCIKTGRFANPNDPSCKSYFYCYIWSNRTVGQYLYSCSIGFFNPNKGVCDVSHVCPCLDTTRTETTSVFTTIQDISTAESTTVSPTAPKYCDLGGNFTCIKTGRFANPNDPSCNSYFYCYVWSNRTVSQYLYSCSIGLFNPNKGACDVSYVCPCLDTSTTEITSAFTTIQDISTAESTTVSTTTPKYCDLGGNFTCIQTGRFANPNDSSCNSYFYCYVWSNGNIGQYLYSCSIGLFNPDKGACDTSYVCPCALTDTTSAVPSSTILSNTYVKSAADKFANSFLRFPWSSYLSAKRNKTTTL